MIPLSFGIVPLELLWNAEVGIGISIEYMNTFVYWMEIVSLLTKLTP